MADSPGGVLARAVESGLLPAACGCVEVAGKRVYEGYFGFSDAQKTRRVQPDTRFRVFSMTKPVIVAAALALCDAGALSLDMDIARLLPEYAGRGIAVRHLMSMTSGIRTYHADASPEVMAFKARVAAAGRAGRPLDTRAMAREIAALPPLFAPGRGFQYGQSIDVLGALAERAAGMRLGDFLRAALFAPLGMWDTGFFVPPGAQKSVCALMIAGEGGLAPAREARYAVPFAPVAYEQGGDGLYSTLSDYARFAAMLLDGQGCAPSPLLSRAALAAMRACVVPALPDAMVRANPFLAGYGYGLGVRVLTRPSPFVPRASLGEVGWYGHAGCWFCADAARALTAVVLAQRLPPAHTRYIPAFYRAALAAADAA